MKNSCIKRTDKLVKVEPDVCASAVVSSNSRLSRFIYNNDEDTPTLYPDTPLNPRIQPVNVVDVIPV